MEVKSSELIQLIHEQYLLWFKSQPEQSFIALFISSFQFPTCYHRVKVKEVVESAHHVPVA